MNREELEAYILNHYSTEPDYPWADTPHAVCLEWDGFTPGRAEHLIAYLRAALERCERVELWHVWLTGYCEYDERPFRKTKRVSLRDLTPHDLEAICEFDVWAQDQTRPTDVCLIITR